MIRRFNYTGRKRIRRRDAQIALSNTGNGGVVFAARLDLSNYKLPATARVFVEAYRQTSWERFAFGTVERPTQSTERELTQFDGVEGIRFRVKVIEPDAEVRTGRPARILAQSDGLRPEVAEETTGKAESLLQVDWGGFGDEVWRLEFDEATEPILRISRHLVSDRDALVRSREFVSLVLPEVLRAILTRILRIDSEGLSLEEASDWRTLWLRFATTLPGVQTPPMDDDEVDMAEEWIDDAVSAFARRTKSPSRFSDWWAEES